MLLLPLLTALLGCASAFQPQPPPPRVPGSECRTLANVSRGVDTVVEGTVHASAAGLVALYVCRRRDGPDCELVGGLFATAAASLFVVLQRFGGTLLLLGGEDGGLGWFSVDDVAFFTSAASLSYQLYLNVRFGVASRRTVVWLSITFFQALALLYRSLRDDLPPGEQITLLLLGVGQTLFCLISFSAAAMTT